MWTDTLYNGKVVYRFISYGMVIVTMGFSGEVPLDPKMAPWPPRQPPSVPSGTAVGR